jgi:hypothetical protein
MKKCIDCNIELKSHGKPKRCVSCYRLHRSQYFKHSEETKIKISKSKTKPKIDKQCSKCDVIVSQQNKTGLCQSCSKKGKWFIGLKINKLEFLNHIGKDKNGYEIWNIKCYCGNKFTAIASKIKTERVRSCGCLNKEHCKKLGKSQTGINNPAWIKDRTKTSLFIRKKDYSRNNQGSWQYFSRKYKIDKNYTCELTGEKMKLGELEVHHIDSVTERPDLVLDKNNVICIKKEIHKNFHKLYGKKTNKNQWEEFIKTFQSRPTLKGAISRYHKFIKGTA